MVKRPKFLQKRAPDPEVQAAYDAAYRRAKLERATAEGYKAGSSKPKSLFDKIGGFGDALAKDLSSGGAKSDFDVGEFLVGSPTNPSTKRKKRKGRK